MITPVRTDSTLSEEKHFIKRSPLCDIQNGTQQTMASMVGDLFDIALQLVCVQFYVTVWFHIIL